MSIFSIESEVISPTITSSMEIRQVGEIQPPESPEFQSFKASLKHKLDSSFQSSYKEMLNNSSRVGINPEDFNQTMLHFVNFIGDFKSQVNPSALQEANEWIGMADFAGINQKQRRFNPYVRKCV